MRPQPVRAANPHYSKPKCQPSSKPQPQPFRQSPRRPPTQKNRFASHQPSTASHSAQKRNNRPTRHLHHCSGAIPRVLLSCLPLGNRPTPEGAVSEQARPYPSATHKAARRKRPQAQRHSTGRTDGAATPLTTTARSATAALLTAAARFRVQPKKTRSIW